MRRVEVQASGDAETDVRAVVEEYTGLLQGWIREDPEQYFWHHKRWKTRPPVRERPSPVGDIT
jgi:KDO2-lipid IV(A) lauroyltransferase